MTSVLDRAPLFANRVTEWRLMRDFMAGERALKTETYIPPLSADWPAKMVNAHVDRAYLFNATEATISGFAGMITVKAPIVEVPPDMDAIRTDVTGDGTSAEGLIDLCADEVCEVGVVGILTDFAGNTAGLTQAQAQALAARAVVSIYKAENVLEVRCERIGGQTKLTRVRLSETVTEPSGEWATRDVKRVRVLELVDGLYQQRLFRAEGETASVQGELIIPQANGARLTEIPFRLICADGSLSEPPRPPMHTLAQANLAHLRDSALHQHSLANCAQPVRMFTGMSAPEGSPPMIGASIAVFAQDPNAKGMIIAAPAEVVGAIVAAMEAKRRDMAVIGARFLSQEQGGQIAENTARINRSGDTASLSKISGAIERGVTESLRFCALFMGSNPGAVKVTLSRNYMPAQMSAQELTAMVGAWQGSGLTTADLYDNLVKGEIVQPREGGYQDWQEELEASGLGLGAVGDNEPQPIA